MQRACTPIEPGIELAFNEDEEKRRMDELQVKTMPALDWHGIWPGYVSHDQEGLYFPQDLP